MGLLVAVAAVAAYFVFFLKPAPPAGPAPVARLTAVEGSVRVKLAGATAWTAGVVSQPLRPGDIVQTDQRSGAEITFVSGNLVRARPDSVILISEGEAAVAQEATAWHVQSGQVNFDLKKDTDIVTASARTRASANSAGNIDVGDDGGTGVKIFRGSAQVSTTRGETVTLADNQAVLVDRGGKAGPTIVLPPVPNVTGPPGKAQLTWLPAPEVITQLRWDVVMGAQTYRVIMDYNVQQANLLLSAALDHPGITTTAHPLQGLDPGSYFWRVAGVSKEGLEGEFSKVALFAVVKPATEVASAPPLSVGATAVLKGIVQVSGRTVPGASVTVDGHDVSVLPDGSFSEFVKNEQPFVIVRATGPDGRFTEEKRAVAAN